MALKRFITINFLLHTGIFVLGFPFIRNASCEVVFSKIVDTKTPVPSTNETFAFLSLPYVDSKSSGKFEFAFNGYHRNGYSKDIFAGSGIYKVSDGKISLIADRSTRVPSMDGQSTFHDFDSKLAMHGGQVAFTAYNSLGQSGIYLANSRAGIQRVADQSTGVPNDGGTFNHFGSPSLNDNGATVFWASSQSGAKGIYYAKDGKLDSCVDTNTTGFSDFDYEPSLKGSNLLFAARTSANEYDVYFSWGCTQSFLYATEVGQQANPSTRFLYPSPQLGSNEFVIFGVPMERAIYKAQLPMSMDNNLPIFHKLLGAGTLLPGGVYLDRIETASIDPNTGDIAFLGVTTDDRRGIYIFKSRDNLIRKLIDTTEMLDSKALVSTPNSIVNGLDMSTRSFNGDSLVFLASFSDKLLDVAIYTAHGLLSDN